MRVEGNITSTGVLRIQGDVQGDVSCDADSGGTIVVGKSENVTGAVNPLRSPLHAIPAQ